MMMQKVPKFSMIVLCYNNFEYIFEALNSVFAQDYPNIELIISDDASVDFNVDKLINYINSKKTQNIQQVIINVNKKNLGTVKHLELLYQKCTGEYVISIAADDVWYDSKVISTFADAFASLGSEAEIVTSQVGMYDHALKNKISNFVSEDDIALIKRQDNMELFEELSFRCFIPGLGTAFRNTVFEKIGVLSDRYNYVEDWTTHLRLVRKGIKIYFVDFTSAKHRDGGISHGNTRASKEVYLKYSQDLLSIYEFEVEPYKHLLCAEKAERAQRYHEYRVERHKKEMEEFRKLQLKQKQKATQAPPDKEVVRKMIVRNKLRGIVKNLAYRISRFRAIQITAFWCLMLFITSSTMKVANSQGAVQILQIGFEHLGLLGLVTVFGQLIVNLIFKARRLMWKRRGVIQ